MDLQQMLMLTCFGGLIILIIISSLAGLTASMLSSQISRREERERGNDD